MQYIDQIQERFEAIVDVADYRINLGEGQSIGVGIRDNDVGSVYSPLRFSDTIGGSFLVHWRDGRLSRGALDGNSLGQFDRVIESARAAAYQDDDAAQFLGHQEITPILLASDDVPPLFEERAGYLFDVIATLEEIAGRYDVKTLNGGTGAGMSASWIRTSRGLNLHNRGTSFSYSASFDGMIGEGGSQRTVVDQPTIVAQIEHAGHYLQQLRHTVDDAASGAYTIVLHPDVAYSLFDFFVWGNMGGAAIYHGQSPWTREDFLAQKQVLRADLEVRVEPWVSLGPSSFGWTGEGVPSAPTTYIDQGRLVSPVLDLKYARRLDLPIRTPPGGERSIHFGARAFADASTLQREVRNGVLVLSVLGLHTQDRSSGNYSLSAPQALLIRDGEIQGRVKATLSGNFLDHLRDDALQLVRFADQHSPGFAYPGHVTFERI
jgi:PmbA protein